MPSSGAKRLNKTVAYATFQEESAKLEEKVV
jgi:hypothetical protein